VFCVDPAAMAPARVLRIVDGDTLHVEFGGRDETVRLYGINATERGQPCSDEATRRLRELAGNAVRLRPDARDRDQYGRLLRYVYSSSGLSVDAELVDEGLAHAWRTDGDLRLAIMGLEARASAGRRGCLWR
jgi:endonuclease YncB( thermonuclease family)